MWNEDWGGEYHWIFVGKVYTTVSVGLWVIQIFFVYDFSCFTFMSYYFSKENILLQY